MAESRKKYEWTDPMSFAQGSHLAALVAVIGVSYLFFSHDSKQPFILELLHLGVFAAYFGAQIWMTFVTGVVLKNRIPRHVFGDVQSHLFPIYFKITTVTSFILFCSYLLLNADATWTAEPIIQAVSLGGSFLLNLANNPITTTSIDLVKKLAVIEREAGHGHEVGFHKYPELQENGEYQRLRKEFVKVHGVISLMNLIALAGSGVHLYYLASSMS